MAKTLFALKKEGSTTNAFEVLDTAGVVSVKIDGIAVMGEQAAAQADAAAATATAIAAAVPAAAADALARTVPRACLAPPRPCHYDGGAEPQGKPDR